MKVAVLGAGGPAGANTCRALKQAGHRVSAFDQDDRHLRFLDEEISTWQGITEISADVVNAMEVDVVLACPDPLVLWLSENRDLVEAATFLPDHRTVELCQDKLQTALAWTVSGLSSGAVFVGPDVAYSVQMAADSFDWPFWLRARRGAGAKGAILATSPRVAYHWIELWKMTMPGIDFICEQYLPGRDIAWTGIYFEGALVTSFARERVEYIYPQLTMTGLTGTPTIATVIHDDDVNAVAEDAVAVVADRPHGIMSVDLRCNQDGFPVPTEINAGRGFTTLGLWSLYGPNFIDLAVKCATAEGATIRHPGVIRDGGMHPITQDALPEGLTLYRHIDCGHRFVLERSPVAV